MSASPQERRHHEPGKNLIPTWPATLAAYILACALFTFIGLPLARKAAFAGVPPLSMAPSLGWAVYTAVALPVFSLAGFSTLAVAVYAGLAIAAAWASWRVSPPATTMLPIWAVCLAFALGVLPLMAIMPKTVSTGILLAPPMFDHVKIALVDGILRDGLPVPNPFYGPQDPGQLAYYYLWHFGAAQFARLLHVGGWKAEAAMTGFTAFSSVMLMTGLAVGLGGRVFAIAAAALLSLPGSLLPLLGAAVGDDRARALIPPGSDIGNWLNQAAWVPQHMASATCVVLSALLMLRLEVGSWITALLLGLTVAAGFESSIWVGGIAFAAAGTVLGLWLLWRAQRREFLLLRGFAAFCLAALLIAPFVQAELHGLAARHSGAGLMGAPYQVFGETMPPGWRTALDIPAFWLLFLPFAFPALATLGAVAMLRPKILRLAPGELTLACTLGITAIACLAVAWMLRSTLDNNDLGWRAVLPALLVLAPMSAVLGERFCARPKLAFAAWSALAALGLPQSYLFARDYAFGQRPGDPAGFVRAEALWRAVRRVAAPDERIANNPLSLRAVTPWPVNIGWALIADRPSCYAGWETVLAYGGVPRATLEGIDARFARVFAGRPSAGDVQHLAAEDNCRIAVLASTDGAWSQDPFAASGIFRLADQGPDWRIYRRVDLSKTDPAVAGAKSAPAAALSYPPPRPDPPSPPDP